MVKSVVVDAYDDRWVWVLRDHMSNPGLLLAVIGDYLTEIAEDSFDMQEYGGIPWLPRYPNQDDNPVNVAGVIQDLNQSDTIQPHRFQDRPALSDSGDLEGSFYWERNGFNSIRYGNHMPYATDMLEGGERKQEVTQEAKDRLLYFLQTEEGFPYIGPLAPVLHEEEHTTDVIPRQFMGFTPQIREELVEMVEDVVAELASGTT